MHKLRIEEIKKSLTITSPYDGIVYFNDKYEVGQWINSKESILSVYDPKSVKIIGFCPEERIYEIKQGLDALFIPDILEVKSIKTTIKNISEVSLPYLNFPELSSDFGGIIATRKDSQDRLRSEEAYYKIEVSLNNFNEIHNIRTRGVLVSNGKATSIAKKLFNKVMITLIKESNF